MKQYPHSFAAETAVNALQFCIVTRARIGENDNYVICCPPSICAHHHLSTRLELTRCGLYNNVIDDAIKTAIACHVFSCTHPCFPRVDRTSFEYTAQQYTDALQNLFHALATSDGKE